MTRVKWTGEAERLLLSPKTAIEVGEVLGVHPVTVRMERIRRGIRRKRGNPGLHWTSEQDAIIRDSSSAYRAAKRLGLGIGPVRNRWRKLGLPFVKVGRPPVKWTPEMDAMLGTANDRVLAQKLGISTSLVTFRRNKLGIAPCRRHEFSAAKKHSDDYLLNLFATHRAIEIASILGVSRARVYQLAKRLGVTPHRKPLRDRTGEMYHGSRVLGFTRDRSKYRMRCGCGREYVVPKLSDYNTSSTVSRRTCGKCSRAERHADRYIGKGDYRLKIVKVLPGGQCLCDCACGVKGIKRLRNNVMRGASRSCGCILREYHDHLRRLSAQAPFVPADLSGSAGSSAGSVADKSKGPGPDRPA